MSRSEHARLLAIAAEYARSDDPFCKWHARDYLTRARNLRVNQPFNQIP